MIIRCHVCGREFDKPSRRNQHVKDAHNTKEPEMTTTHAPGADKPSDATVETMKAILFSGRVVDTFMIHELYRASLAAVPASEPAWIEARRYCKGDQEWTDWAPMSAEGRARHENDPTFEFRYVAAPAPVSGMPDLAKRLNEIDRHLAKCRFTERHAARQLVYSMLHDVCGTPAPQAPDTPVAPNYPEGDVLANCICGGWPGGKCLKCSIVATLPAAPAPTEQARPIARLMHWEAPKHMRVPHGGVCARTFAEFPKGAGDNGYWKEGEPLFTRAALAARPAPTEAANGDAIAKSKRILNLVDEYELRPTSGNRTTLRMALMSEFEAVGQAPDSRVAALELAGEAIAALQGMPEYGCGEGSDHQVETARNKARAKAAEALAAIAKEKAQ